MAESTGYGPSSRYNRLIFNGDAEKYELFEEKFMGYLRIKKLKAAVCSTSDELNDDEKDKNEEAYAELIQFLDEKSISLIRRDAKNDCRGSLKILQSHYIGKGKPRVISLWTELTSIRKTSDQSAVDYMLKAEAIAASLKTAGETISDSLYWLLS